MRRITSFALAVLFVLPAVAAGAQKGQFTVPMRVFADLLKIPTEPPAVMPTVHSTREEQGLVIEDVSWPSIDGDTAPSFIVRPAKATGRLPAVVCLHGSSTSREANIAPKFGYAESFEAAFQFFEKFLKVN